MRLRPGPIPVTFEGQTLSAMPGQSLAAVLIASGILALRESSRGAERGLFCGMGVCQECLVVVDGVPNQRACTLKVTRPLRVARQTPATLPADDAGHAPVSVDDYRVERPQILVIGGGAGGLASALAARRAGADVVLLDERGTAGGQYYKQAAVGEPGGALDAQQAAGQRLVEAVARSGAIVVPECEVWGAFPADDAAADIFAVDPGGARRFHPARRCPWTRSSATSSPPPGSRSRASGRGCATTTSPSSCRATSRAAPRATSSSRGGCACGAPAGR